MDGIIINDKQYKFIETDNCYDCDECDLNIDDICQCSMICEALITIKGIKNGSGIFKELKIEK
jgi:hypothetical protein